VQKVTIDVVAGGVRQVGMRFGQESVSNTPEKEPRLQLRSDRGGTGEMGQETPNRTILIAGGVTAGVGLVTGVVFTVLANSEDKTAKGELTERGAAFSNIAVWGFLGGGLAGAATLVYGLVVPMAGKAQSGLQFNPIAMTNGVGMSLSGHW
jgi:hypothetical protein